MSLLTEAIHREFFVPQVEKAFADHFDVTARPDAKSEEALAEALQSAEGCMTSWSSPRLTPAVLESAPRLRMIGHVAGSVKDYIDPVAWDMGIVVVNAAHVIAHYVGEMALLLTLALLRNLPQNDRAMRDGVLWKPHEWTHTDTLHGKVVGLVGFGAAARSFAALLKPFDVELIAFDPYAPHETLDAFGASRVELGELARQAEVVSLHAPLTPETEGMISGPFLASMRDGACLINTARGALVDEASLLEAVQRGRIKAALDVFGEEPLPLDHPFRRTPGLILSPHLSGPVMTSRWRMALSVARDFTAYLVHGKQPQHVIHKRQLDIMT